MKATVLRNHKKEIRHPKTCPFYYIIIGTLELDQSHTSYLDSSFTRTVGRGPTDRPPGSEDGRLEGALQGLVSSSG